MTEANMNGDETDSDSRSSSGSSSKSNEKNGESDSGTETDSYTSPRKIPQKEKKQLSNKEQHNNTQKIVLNSRKGGKTMESLQKQQSKLKSKKKVKKKQVPQSFMTSARGKQHAVTTN